MKKSLIPLLTLALSACASHPEDIKASYVSPLQYKDYDCGQIGQEMERVSRRTSELAGSIDKKASTDSAQMGVGLILFWPTLFFLDGDGPDAQEYARLKGEFDTLEKVAVEKRCNIAIERPKIPVEQPQQQNAPAAYPGAK